MNERKDIDDTVSGDNSHQKIWKAVRDAIKQYTDSKESEYQELLDEKYAQVVESYYLIVNKLEPTEEESEWLSDILQDAESNEDLALLLEIADDITFEEMGYNDSSFKPFIEGSRKRIRDYLSKIRRTYRPEKSIGSTNLEKLAEVSRQDKPERKLSGLFASIFETRRNYGRSFCVGAIGASMLLAVAVIKTIIAINGGGIVGSVSESSVPVEDVNVDTESEHECAVKRVGWISDAYEGSRTAYREIYDPNEYTAAHPFLPPQSEVYLQPSHAGQDETVPPIVVRVIDEGSVGRASEGMLVSHETAEALDIIEEGVASIEIVGVLVNNQSNDELTRTQTVRLRSFVYNCASMVENIEQTRSAITAGFTTDD